MSREGPSSEARSADACPRAILLAGRAIGSATVHGTTEAVTPTAVRVRLPQDLGDADTSMRRRDPRELTSLVRRRLGEGSRLGLVVGDHTAWCGAVHLVGVEVPDASSTDFVAVFQLEKPLSVADQRLLGLEVDDEPRRDFASQRGAERVPVTMPAQVLTAAGAVLGTVKDLSTTGVRVHLRPEDLGFPATSDMSELARGLGARLGTRFEINLNHTVLGNLLAQGVQLTRLCAVHGEEGLVELGGRFLDPLTSEAAAVLGISLPAPGETPEEASAREAPPAPTPRAAELPTPVPRSRPPAPPLRPVPPQPADEALEANPALGACSRRVLQALVSCKAAGAPPATSCQTEIVGMGGVVLRMERTCVGGSAPGDEANILHISRRFTEVFGDEATLKLHDGHIHLWSGPARVVAIQLPPDRPTEMLVTFAYARTLRPAEITRLGLSRLAG